MSEQMHFERTWKEFLNNYSFKDKYRTYTNGAELIPVFRVEQMVEHYFINKKQIDTLTIGVEVDDNGGVSKLKENLKEVETLLENINDLVDKINEKIDIKTLLATSLLINNTIVYDGGYKDKKLKEPKGGD